MATAGRILIMPKGTWNAETTYENLDMVAHSGRAWLAKKVSVGIEPSDANAEFWHDFLGMDVFTEENPPTAAQVGAVSLYADPVLSKSTDWDNLESGTYRFSTWGGSGGVGYPPIDDVGICILFDTEAGRYMYCLGMNRIVSRCYESKTWSDWIEGYLPLTGGTLTKDLLIKSASSTATSHFINYNDATYVRSSDGTQNNYADIVVSLSEAVRYTKNVNGSYNSYNIFGEHNKPTVTYTGNGSTTRRYVTVGGIGEVVFVQSSESGVFAFITNDGAIIKNGTSLTCLDVGESYLYKESMTIELNTTNAAFNKSGVTYTATLL